MGALLIFAALFAISGYTPPNALVLGLVLLPAALAIGVLHAYFSAIRQEHRLTMLAEGSPLRRILGGPVLRLAIASLVGFGGSLAILAKTSQLSDRDLYLMLAGIPLLYLAVRFASPRLERHVAPRYAASVSLRLGLWMTAFALAIAGGLLEPSTPRSEAAHALADQPASGVYLLIADWARAVASLEGAFVDAAGGGGMLIRSLFDLAAFAATMALFAAVLLPVRELRRAILPTHVASGQRPLRPNELAVASAVGVLLAGFVYFPLLAQWEAALQRPLPAIGEQADASLGGAAIALTEWIERRVEQIGDDFHEPGTTDRLTKLNEEWLREQQTVEDEFSAAVDYSFQAMRGNVPEFLDWYYSLGGEYARTAGLLTGSGEDVLRNRLEEILVTAEGRKDITGIVGSAQARFEQRRADLAAQREAILGESRVTLGETERPVVVARVTDITDLLNFEDVMVSGIAQRLSVGVSTGGLSGAVAAVTLKKVASKGVLKTATKAVAKAAAGKAAGGAGGAAAGAFAGGALGSIVPGIGTAAGALVGGVAGGLLGGVAVDKVLIELEEFYGRETFETELIAAIDEAEAGIRSELGLPGN